MVIVLFSIPAGANRLYMAFAHKHGRNYLNLATLLRGHFMQSAAAFRANTLKFIKFIHNRLNLKPRDIIGAFADAFLSLVCNLLNRNLFFGFRVGGVLGLVKKPQLFDMLRLFTGLAELPVLRQPKLLLVIHDKSFKFDVFILKLIDLSL